MGDLKFSLNEIMRMLEERENLLDDKELFRHKHQVAVNGVARLNFIFDEIGLTNFNQYERDVEFIPRYKGGAVLMERKKKKEKPPPYEVGSIIKKVAPLGPIKKTLRKNIVPTLEEMQEASRIRYSNNGGKEHSKTNKIIKRFTEPPVLPDDPKPIIRPKAQYTNIPSPYGIATEMLQNQLKTG